MSLFTFLDVKVGKFKDTQLKDQPHSQSYQNLQTNTVSMLVIACVRVFSVCSRPVGARGIFLRLGHQKSTFPIHPRCCALLCIKVWERSGQLWVYTGEDVIITQKIPTVSVFFLHSYHINLSCCSGYRTCPASPGCEQQMSGPAKPHNANGCNIGKTVCMLQEYK